MPGILQKAQAVGFLPNARRDVEVEIVRMLPAVTPGEPRSLTKRVAKKNAKKTDLAACNTLESQPVRIFGFLKSGRVCGLYGRVTPARKTAVHLTFDLLVSNRLRDPL